VTCPCRIHSDQPDVSYEQCCKPLHQGEKAASAEALMRSRYSAFALGLEQYLLTSWHPDTRPQSLSFDDSADWKRLEIIRAEDNGESGEVHFKAWFKEEDQWQLLEETSLFFNIDGHWYYHSGDYRPQTLKPGRNDSCPCGSGKKFKKCCG